MAITKLNTAKELHYQFVDWFYHVNELSDKEFQLMVIKLNNDLNDDNFHIRELIQSTLNLIKMNRMEK